MTEDSDKGARVIIALDAPLLTEGDVEDNVIAPILRGANYLEIPSRHIKSKAYLAPAVLDKVSGKTHGYYPDYSIWEKSLPVLIVEAKSPDVAAEVGYREASLYARHLNQEYRSDLNPCRYILSCNGTHVLVGTWDSKPELEYKVSDLTIGSPALQRLREYLHYRVLQSHAQLCLSRIKIKVAVTPFNTLTGGSELSRSRKPFNTFAVDLAPVLRKYFTSSSQNSDPDIYQRGYVGSDEVTRYDQVLESLLKDRLPGHRGSVVAELEPTKKSEPKLTGAIRDFSKNHPLEGQLQLVTGGVGVGKSLFARRYKELLQRPELAASTYWAFIDFNTAPPSLNTAERWLCEAFLESFQSENANCDPYEEQHLNRLFAPDLKQQKGIYDQLRKINPDQAALQRAHDLASWKADPERFAAGLCRYLCGDRGETVVVVMDNVDKQDLQQQLTAFQLSLWFMKKTRTFVILQMRDETYERYKTQRPLDTFRSGIIFHISPPRFTDVVRKRLELGLEYLAAHAAEKLEYVLDSGARIVYPKGLLGEFLKEIYLELFGRRRNISWILEGIAGRDVRRALEMFVSILNSGHLSEEAITSNVRGAKSILIQERLVLKILMRTEYRFFSKGSGFITNIFDFNDDWENGNNFICSDILYWLFQHRKVEGEIGLQGYFSMSRLADVLQLRGYIRSDVRAASNELLRGGLIEADQLNTATVNFQDCVKITSSGFIHLRILSSRIEYLYGVLASTPITERRIAERFANYLSVEAREGDIAGRQKLKCVEAFEKYLSFNYRRLAADSPLFGAGETGASYVISQIREAIAQYKNPVRKTTNERLL